MSQFPTEEERLETAEQEVRRNARTIKELESQIAKYDRDITRMVDAIRGYCAQGMALPIGSIGGMEGAVIALAAEAVAQRTHVTRLRKTIQDAIDTLDDAPTEECTFIIRRLGAALEDGK